QLQGDVIERSHILVGLAQLAYRDCCRSCHVVPPRLVEMFQESEPVSIMATSSSRPMPSLAASAVSGVMYCCWNFSRRCSRSRRGAPLVTNMPIPRFL